MIALKDGKILTITRMVIEEGAILIENGKIKTAGKDVQIPLALRSST